MSSTLRGFVALALGAALVVGGASAALAGHDSTPDGPRCDTWYRSGHGSGSSHGHTDGSDVDAVVINVHAHSGHYVVRGDAFYLEVVGGSYYSSGRPEPGAGAGNQGGYVQGEVDPGAPIPVDGDFHANFFADGKAAGCLSAADTKVGDEGDDPYH